MFSIDHLKAGLNTEFLGHKVKYLEKTKSTNDVVWEFFNKDESSGFLTITDNQYGGRGRRQSNWFSISGKSLTFSFLLVPRLPYDKLELLPLLAGVSIVKGISIITDSLPGLKWPNDIILSNKKMGGILIESKNINNKLGIAIGIGLNINESLTDFSKEIQNKTTSLYIDSGKENNLELVLSSILNEFENLYLNNWHEIIPQWEKNCIHKNHEVTFHNDSKRITGKFLGITKSGYAKIQQQNKIEIFSSGMVTI